MQYFVPEVAGVILGDDINGGDIFSTLAFLVNFKQGDGDHSALAADRRTEAKAYTVVQGRDREAQHRLAAEPGFDDEVVLHAVQEPVDPVDVRLPAQSPSHKSDRVSVSTAEPLVTAPSCQATATFDVTVGCVFHRAEQARQTKRIKRANGARERVDPINR